MVLKIIKETIEQDEVTTDADGNAWLTKRINLDQGKRHFLRQVDVFEDAYMSVPAEPNRQNMEIVVTPFPAIPTNMIYQYDAPQQDSRYPAAGDDSILFKARFDIRQNGLSEIVQFPSVQIAANNAAYFYTDHVFLNVHIAGANNTTYYNLALSFMLVMDDKNVSTLEHSLGVISEQHEAMCAQIMSNGRMRSRLDLEGNVFPMWRYGGIRPERTLTPQAANSFFLDIASRDSEEMVTSAAIRTLVADARQMQPFDAALGLRRPDWLREFLNAGLESGPIRPNPIPLRYADNGNTRMF
jgi:hypothetical protein